MQLLAARRLIGCSRLVAIPDNRLDEIGERSLLVGR